MQKITLTIRFLLFTVFFLAGAGAIVLSMLAAPELENFYKNRALLDELRKQNERIAELTDGYADRIKLIESEPNILTRFSTAAFGQEPEAPDTVFPKATNEALRAETEKILNTEFEPAPIDPLPRWLRRILEPGTRKALFLTGAGLILVNFIFFGTTRKAAADINP